MGDICVLNCRTSTDGIVKGQKERIRKLLETIWLKKRSGSEVKMPCLTLATNVNLDAVDISSIFSQIISTVANAMNRPYSYVTVALEGSIPMSFGGTEEPAAYGELVSIGVLNPDLNKKLSAEIALILQTKLSVPKSRFYLKFYDIEGYNCGLNGSIMVKEK